MPFNNAHHTTPHDSAAFTATDQLTAVSAIDVVISDELATSLCSCGLGKLEEDTQHALPTQLLALSQAQLSGMDASAVDVEQCTQLHWSLWTGSVINWCGLGDAVLHHLRFAAAATTKDRVPMGNVRVANRAQGFDVQF